MSWCTSSPPLQNLLTIDRLSDSDDPPNEAPSPPNREEIRRLVTEIGSKVDLVIPSVEDTKHTTAEMNRDDRPVLASEIKQEEDQELPSMDDIEPYAATSDEDEPPRATGRVSGVAVKYEHRLLNIKNVTEIMKAALPKNAKVAKDAKECMQECASEFISFITSEANDICTEERLATIDGEDIIQAMINLGFDNYAKALQIYLARYRQNLEDQDESQPPDAVGSGGKR